MAFTHASHLTSAHAGLTAEEALRAPVDVLLGVGASARLALESLGIRTVFDLAASEIFATAAMLRQAETDPTLAESRLNLAAADAVTAPIGVPISEWSRHGLTILAGLDAAQAATLSTALDVTTVRDLSLWPPLVAAREILENTFGLVTPGADLEAPPDLQPTSGRYATERVYFRRLVIDLAQLAEHDAAPVEGLTGIDLKASLAAPSAFQRVATGALLTFKQSWFSEGVTLGQLLHSLSLAPGESTRVAVIDWLRRTRSSATEDIDERERLTNEQDHTRALNEVTSATATEFQAGSSSTSVTSTTGQTGGALGLEIGPLALGGSQGGSSSTTEAYSASSSFGARDLAASLSQAINDRTQQHATAARSRRASAVREVSQSEHESISTRVVANYNHMHALTVQYYETVQAYRVTTELDRAERCLFVPLNLLDFRNVALVDRLRSTLAGVALTPAAFRQLTAEYGTVEVIPQTPRVTPGTVGLTDLFTIGSVVQPAASGATTGGGTGITGPAASGMVLHREIRDEPASVTSGASAAPADTPAPAALGVSLFTAVRFDQGPASAPAAIAAVKGWNLAQLNLLGSITGHPPLRRGSDSVFLPQDALLLSVAVRDGQLTRIQVRSRENVDLPEQSSTQTSVVLASPAKIGSLLRISVQNAQDRDVATTFALSVSVNGSVVPIDVPVRFKSKATTAGDQEIVRFGAVGPAPQLVQHLEANRLYYSRAVFARLDASAIAGILSRFTYRGLPLGRVVDPRPVATTANFLVFKVNVPRGGEVEDERFTAELRDFEEFLQSRGLDRPAPQSRIVPLPSEGVFAEAVLGRFNSAEKIDLTRFWNWQDSPIPITAPDIAPISAASRAEAEGLRPGQLGAPVVSIQAPTALPAAAGVAPMLQAIQTANLFRDMSGMEATAALAQSAVKASGAGATSAGAIAAQNLKTTMEQHTARMKIAADMLGAMMAPGSGGTVSEGGAQLNAAAELDKKSTAPGVSAAPASDGQAPESLEAQTVKRQSGADLAGASASIAETAVKGAAETPPTPTAQPRTGGATPGTSRPAGGSAPTAPATPTTPTAPTTPTEPTAPETYAYRLTVRFGRTGNTAIDGVATVTLTHGGLLGRFLGGNAVLGVATTVTSQPLSMAFRTALTSIRVFVLALTARGAVLQVTKNVLLPWPPFDDLPFTLDVTPVIRISTFTVPAAGLLQPDMANLENQLMVKQIPPLFRIGDPDFSLLPGMNFTAKVRHFTGDLKLRMPL